MAKKLDNIVHNHLGAIITTNGNFKVGLAKLKNSGNFPAIYATADRLTSASLAYHKYLYGNPRPEDIESLGVSKPNFFSKKLRNEIDWLLLSIRKYHAELSLFLNYKTEFERAFLLGDYPAASTAVDTSIADISYSVWAIGSKMLIHEYLQEKEKAKILMTEVFEKNRDGLFTSSLVNFLSQRAEKKLSAYKYDNDLRNALRKLKSNLTTANKDYYRFQLNFFDDKQFTELNDILNFDYSNSLIDRYLTFRRLVFYTICNGEELEYLAGILPYTLRKVADPIFDPLMLFIKPEMVRTSYFDIDYIKLIDLFYAGLYDDFITQSSAALIKDPSNFTLINLYCRSLIFSGKPFTQPTEKPCLVNEIAENIYKIYARKSNPTEPLYNLYQISKNIDSFDINYQLSYFIKHEQNIAVNNNYFYFSLPKMDPKFMEVLTEHKEKAAKLMELVTAKTYASLSFAYKFNSINDNFESCNEIAKERSLIDSAISQFNRKEYTSALPTFQSIFESNAHIQPIQESAINYIFRILVATEKVDECIRWYVDCYLKNPFSVFKIETNEIHKLIKKKRFKNISIDIYLPVFISLIVSDENEKSFALELYCKSLDAQLPSTLVEENKLEYSPLTELFLSKSCNNETLKHYRHISNTKKRLEERIRICDFLAKQYPKNQKTFIEELDLLTNELIIYEGTTKLDDSKIYANDNAILSNELQEYEGLYNRYITIAGLYFKHIKILTINKNELRYLNKKNETDYSQNEIEYSNQAHLDAYYNIMSVIRDRFLFSKFGIVTYLSTRIRHGVFLGELRPELEKYKLIFFKNKLKNTYEIDSYWMSLTDLTTQQRQDLTNTLVKFSDEIDSLIESLIKENIQIKLKDDENTNGWFDYVFSDAEIADQAVTLFYEEDFKVFCKKVLEVLWVRTDENLNHIRELLQTEVKNKFLQIFTRFEAELNRNIPHNQLPQIFTALTSCSTSISNKIDKISTWFKRSGRKHSDFLIEPLISIICSSVQRSYPSKSLNLSITQQVSIVVKGEYYEHFKDFLRILIDNMLKHSGKNEIDCKISLSMHKSILEIELENNHPSPDADIPVMQVPGTTQIDGVKLITEGKSGLMKVIKTIRDDLKNELNEVYIKAPEDKSYFRVTVHIDCKHLTI